MRSYGASVTWEWGKVWLELSPHLWNKNHYFELLNLFKFIFIALHLELWRIAFFHYTFKIVFGDIDISWSFCWKEQTRNWQFVCCCLLVVRVVITAVFALKPSFIFIICLAATILFFGARSDLCGILLLGNPS